MQNATRINKTNNLFLAIFLFTTFSGAVRKWLLPSGGVNTIFTVIQIVIPLLVLWIPLKNKSQISVPNKKILVAYCFILLFLAFNPLNLTIFHGLAGFIIYIGFWLIVFIYIQFRPIIDITALTNTFLWVSWFVIAIAIIQYASPQTSIINRYANENEIGEGLAKVGDAVRVTGSFSYLSGFTSFLIFYVFLICSLFFTKGSQIKIIAGLILGFLANLLSGSRSSLALYLVFVFSFIFFCLPAKQYKYLIQGSLILFLILLIIIGIGDPLHFVNYFNTAYDNYLLRFESNQDESQNRIMKLLTQAFLGSTPEPVFGVGLGATYQGVRSIFGTSPILSGIPYENENFRIVLEGGYLLFCWKIFLFILLFLNLKLNKVYLLVILLTSFFLIGIVFNIYNTIYLALGLILLDQAKIKYSSQTLP